MGGPANPDTALDDDEDVTRGDSFDHLSPRDISLARYTQNHEWMEEILSSPYRISQIEVADIGLGRKGELASLTQGIFEAQGSDALEVGPSHPYTGHLAEGLADEFRNRVHERNASVRAEIQRMNKEHARVLKSFQSTVAIKQAEQELRHATESVGSEFWRLEGRLEPGEEAPSHFNSRGTHKIEDLLARVEALVNKRATAVHDVNRVQDGGYIEPVPEPEPPVQPSPPGQRDQSGSNMSASMSRQPSHAGSQNSGVMVGDSDIDMGGTAASLLDQMHPAFSSTSTPINNFATPQPHHLSAIPSAVATPVNLNAPSPRPLQVPISQPQSAAGGEDAKMVDAEAPKGGPTGPEQGAGGLGEWVVPKGGVSPSSANPAAGSGPGSSGTQLQQALASKPASSAPTPGGGGGGLGFDGDNNDFSSLGDLDTAGDALASYDPPSVDTGALGDMNMDMEDSAFGDAFHGVQQSGANTPGDI